MSKALVCAVLCAIGSTLVRAEGVELSERAAAEPYAPFSVPCAVRPAVRPATGLGHKESSYVEARQTLATQQLVSWLDKTFNGSASWEECELPRIAIALSGGGPKAGLTTAGVVQAFDSRDSSFGISGILQSSTYLSALSGGSLTLSGLMVNDFPKISVLKESLYDLNYQNPFLLPLQNPEQIKTDVDAKNDAGYRTSVVDQYGRAIAYDFIGGSQGGNGLRWSNVTKLSSFKSHEAPYPIITLTDTAAQNGVCFPPLTGAIWEAGPYEFGSWDPTVKAFYPTKYLGTPTPADPFRPFNGSCTLNFDNAGFITGISSDTFASQQGGCSPNGTETLTGLGGIVYQFLPAKGEQSPFGIVPNPFYGDASAGEIQKRDYLYMADGGDSGQGIPIFPFLQPERKVDVLFVIDAESTAPKNITDGSSLYRTYTQAQRLGLKKMPVIPDPTTFAAENLDARASFFGCNDTEAATLVFIPNTYSGEYPSSDYFFTPEGVQTVFDGGVKMTTQDGDADWPTAVACAILHKKPSTLPSVCDELLNKYCWTS